MSRSETLTLHLTPEQMAWVERLADKANLPVGEVIGLLVLASAHEDLIEAEDVPDADEAEAVPTPSTAEADGGATSDADDARAAAENVLEAFANPNARTELDGSDKDTSSAKRPDDDASHPSAPASSAEDASPAPSSSRKASSNRASSNRASSDEESSSEASDDDLPLPTGEEDDESVLSSLRNAYKRLNDLKKKENKGESTKARLRRLRWLQDELQTVTDENASDEDKPSKDGGSVPGRQLIEQALDKMRNSAKADDDEDSPTSMFDYPHPEDEKPS